jgi:L-aspartate oxidase
MAPSIRRDISHMPVIVGGGIAGLMTALRLAPMPVVVLTKAPLQSEASSGWAQGGIAAAMGSDDSPALHFADTIAAGAGLCDVDVARRVTMAAPAAIEALLSYGVLFDRGLGGSLQLGMEAAHSRHRIVHVAGDGAGKEIMRALAEAVRATPSITMLEGFEARRLLVADGAIIGALMASQSGGVLVPTNRVVLASGGVGGLFQHTTNPRGSFGQGLALAARAGAALIDMEFVQFHPTALDTGGHPLTLVSEAVRGEGATLIDETGARFVGDVPGKELAPRDVVARAVWQRLAEGHRVYLDTRAAIGAEFPRHFPVIASACAAAGIDPVTQPIPVRPAAHYHMGGIAVDHRGRTTIHGLWACGEVAGTGLHGANRLASNSLLEAVVGAGWVADDIAGTSGGRNLPFGTTAKPTASDPEPVRPILSRAAGVLRDYDDLAAAVTTLLPWVRSAESATADPALVGLFIVVAALLRKESRGGHYRTDFPRPVERYRYRRTMTLEALLDAAHEIEGRFGRFNHANSRGGPMTATLSVSR